MSILGVLAIVAFSTVIAVTNEIYSQLMIRKLANEELAREERKVKDD